MSQFKVSKTVIDEILKDQISGIVQDEVEKKMKELRPIIVKQIASVMESKSFQKYLETRVETDIKYMLDDCGIFDFLSNKETEELMGGMVRNFLRIKRGKK